MIYLECKKVNIIMKKSIIVSLILLISSNIWAQLDTLGLPIITNYEARTYKAHYQNWDAAQAANGMMFFANTNGVLSFTGADWNLFQLPNKPVITSIHKTDDNRIFVGGIKTFGYLTNDSTFNVSFKEIIHPNDFDSSDPVIWDIKSLKQTVWARTVLNLFKINENKVDTFKSDYPIIDFFIEDNNKVFIGTPNGLSVLESHTLKQDSSGIFLIKFFEKNDSIFALSKKHKLYTIINDTLQFYSDFKFSPQNPYNISFFNNNYLLFPTDVGLYITDLKGNIYFEFNKKLGLVNSTIKNVFIDNMNNIWALTSKGISYIEISSPIQIIDDRSAIETTNPTFFKYYNNTIYVGTGTNVLKLNDEKNGLYKVTNDLEGQSWEAIEIGNDLYIANRKNLIRISNKERKTYTISNIWTIIKSEIDSNDYILGTTNGLFLYNYNRDSLKFVKKIDNFKFSSRKIMFDKNKNLWVGNDIICKLKFDNDYNIIKIDTLNANNGLTNNSSINFFNWKDTVLISTYKTLFMYDELNDTIHPYHKITDKFIKNKNKDILQLVNIDDDNNFWFEYKKEDFTTEVLCITEKNNVFVETNQYLKRLNNIGFSCFSQFSSSHYVIGTPDFFAFFKNDTNYKITTSVLPIINKITFYKKDTIVFNNINLTPTNDSNSISNYNVSYKNNNVKFNYSFPFFIESEQTTYTYMLKGYDEKWSDWTTQNFKEYTDLPFGNYIFLVKAKNIYGIESSISEFGFSISKPWYKTILAYFIYVILFFGFMYLTIHLFTSLLRKTNKILENKVNERTKEITEKNAELESQKEEIISQAEELLEANNKLERLSAIAQETDNAVILTDEKGDFVWLNNAYTKIFGYTLEELKEQVSPNIISDKTDAKTKESILRCFEYKTSVNYELKVKNRNGEYIWVQTTVTPILDNKNEIKALIIIDADITSLKNYQNEIKNQKQEIEAINSDLNNQKEELLTTLDNLKKTQAELIQAEKMASLGQLIAGVAHEINTPIGAINASIGTIKASSEMILELYPKISKILTPDENILFNQLIQSSQNASIILSSKEERQIKKQIRQILQENQIENERIIADKLTDMKITENIEKYFLLLKNKNSDLIINTAFNISELNKNSKNIETAISRVSKIIFALKNYSRQDKENTYILSDITENINTVLTLYHNQLKHGINLKKEFEQIPQIKCLPDELNQVWTNLTHNAIQAMNRKGTLSIIISNKDDKTLKIGFKDTGKGITPEIRNKVFNSFFTTKKAGEGTGLGLFIVKKIIDKHNGNIYFESVVDKGTTFWVELPKNL